ncbi:MAG: MoaD/ThiS family protein [Candidatus Lokiarchaeota archaeon]|nr:MoaD/ThiS family protein [Candidatus Lokiarchaeota archaeon]
MVKIELNLLNIFQLKVGKRAIIYEGDTVQDVISKFLNQYGEHLDAQILSNDKKRLGKQMVIILNGRNIDHLQGYDTRLKVGDMLYISAQLAGG